MLMEENMTLTKNDLAEIRKINKEGLDALRKEIDKEIDQKVDQGVNVLKVLIEDVRSDIRLLAEGREIHVEKFHAHDTKLTNHEGRITTLEDYTYTKGKV